MATDSEKRRAVVPGYSLQEIARGGDLDFALRLLGDWARSRNHRLMWASAAAAWRVYLALSDLDDKGGGGTYAERVLQVLQLLSTSLKEFSWNDPEKPKQQIFASVVEAMKRIVLADPERAVRTIATWIRSTNDDQTKLGRRVTRTVFQSNGSPEAAEAERD